MGAVANHGFSEQHILDVLKNAYMIYSVSLLEPFWEPRVSSYQVAVEYIYLYSGQLNSGTRMKEPFLGPERRVVGRIPGRILG